ncbi:GDT1-like protein 5 [Mangifera indica]|uniref:GDT1-like protein 5 n=1 Tax=Mangifera indica TaxID=29780 RepID=UPI001CFB9EE3|nr:GDT1-like protein 5 [Mangifera indica]
MEEMNLSMLHAFTKSLAMTVLSEAGDRTFCISAILAMRYPRRSVFLGCLFSDIAMTIVSALIGWAAPNLISKTLTHHITTFLFFVFGLQSLWGGLTEDDDDNEELTEVEKELDADLKANTEKSKAASTGDEDLKKHQKPILTHFFTPVFLKAFSLTFFAEWGDKSQLATIGLAAHENTLGVVLGGITGQAICVVAAVLGGKTLASRISERLVTVLSGGLFLVFGITSYLSPPA